jgi:hypothetical protein
MATTRTREGLTVAIVITVLVTAGCSATAPQDPAERASATSAADPEQTRQNPAVSTTEGTFVFADGATVGILTPPWTTTDRIEGQLVHMIPGAAGTNFDDAVWGDLIVYVPDAAYGPGASEPEAMPTDPVAWTAAHTDLEILDQREITVDGVTATQIDARSATTTNWLAVEAMPFGWGGDERVVLIPLDGSWLIVRGSAFQPDVAFAETPEDGDAFAAVLDSIDLPG